MLTRLLFLFVFSSYLLALPPVDIVYTWVDGSDPAWQVLKKSEYQKQCQNLNFGSDATAQRRFRSRDELKYSLRSILQFAPWINHIYIVTCDQKPKWLKPHPKITLVSHKTIFSSPSHLPTFNSMAIECHLHCIPGLHEHYIYFNDDVFLGRKVDFYTFFTKKEKMKVFFSSKKLTTDEPEDGEEGYTAAKKNTANILNKFYGEETRYALAHTPFPFLKSIVEAIEKKFPTIFTHVSSHKFRSLEDFTITNGLIPYVALQYGHAEKGKASKKLIHYGYDLEEDIKSLERLTKKTPVFFCIEDSNESESAQSAQNLQTFFEEYFPTPAPWEEI